MPLSYNIPKFPEPKYKPKYVLNSSKKEKIVSKEVWRGQEGLIGRIYKEVPWCTFLKGSFTVEATVVLPVVICVFIFIMFFFRIIEVQTGIQKALDESSRIMAVSTGIEGENTSACLASEIVLAEVKMAKYKVPMPYIFGGRLGISFLNSSDDGEYVDLNTSCYLPCPIRIFGFKGYAITNRAKVRKWVGYKPPSKEKKEQSDETIVYVAETGVVYHLTPSCTYLDPSIRAIDSKALAFERNKSGGIYYECSKCGGKGDMVFVTNYGTVYHSTLACSGLKRTISTMKLDEAKKSYPACSKCGGEHASGK